MPTMSTPGLGWNMASHFPSLSHQEIGHPRLTRAIAFKEVHDVRLWTFGKPLENDEGRYACKWCAYVSYRCLVCSNAIWKRRGGADFSNMTLHKCLLHVVASSVWSCFRFHAYIMTGAPSAEPLTNTKKSGPRELPSCELLNPNPKTPGVKYLLGSSTMCFHRATLKRWLRVKIRYLKISRWIIVVSCLLHWNKHEISPNPALFGSIITYHDYIAYGFSYLSWLIMTIDDHCFS